MCCIFMVPIFMRPMDFLFHMKGYLIGMFTYIFMLPTFINIMAIYSMCNLHDISWGNRPSAAAAMAQVSAVAKQQAELDKDYKMFRVNFVAYWVVGNVLWVLFLTIISNIHTTHLNDGVPRAMDISAMFLSGIVVYRVFFGGLHILWFKIRVMCN